MQNQDSHLPKSTSILVADDDSDVRRLLALILKKDGYDVIEAFDGADALAKMRPDIGVALIDHSMPNVTGLECLTEFRRNFSNTEVIMLSVGGVSTAVSAMQNGAFWYLQKPVNAEELLALIAKAKEVARLRTQSTELMEALTEPHLDAATWGSYLVPQALAAQLERIAAMDCTVLLTGETGVGKSTLARCLHQRSKRNVGPFVAISCAALPRDLLEAELFGYEKGAFTGAVKARPGRFELADSGTLFLDEIGDMTLDLQPKLLTFLENRILERIGSTQSKKVNLRIIAATLQDLSLMCSEKRFREDLFFRLKVITLHIPPLRERRDELPMMVRLLLEKLGTHYGLSSLSLDAEAWKKVRDYHWPGNVRELENSLERAILLADGKTITPDLIAVENIRTSATANVHPLSLAGIPLAELEEEAIRQTLVLVGGNKREAARRLGISEKSIYNKMHRMKEHESV